MTREQFVARAVRAAERVEGLPAGWWGTYNDVRSPRGVRMWWRRGAARWAVAGRALPTTLHRIRDEAMRAARRRERS